MPGYRPKPSFPILDRTNPLANGLVGAWVFSKGAGSTLQNVADSRYSGDITAATWGNGRYGSQLIGDGSTTFVDVDLKSFGQKIGTGFSFFALVRSTSTTTGSLIGNYESSSAVGPTFQIEINRAASMDTSGGVFCYLRQSAQNGPELTGYVTGTNINNGEWHSLFVQFDTQATTIRLLVDGVSYAVTYTKKISNVNPTTNMQRNLYLMAHNNNGVVGRPLNGDMALAYLWDGLPNGRALHADPFAIVRPRMPLWAVAAAETGANMSAIMANYRRRRAG